MTLSAGISPSERVFELIRQILKALYPEYQWFVGRSLPKDRIDIGVHHWEMRGTSLILDTKEDIGYKLHYCVLKLIHHDEWHKGLSIGGITREPYDWYPQLADQLKYLEEHPEYWDKVFQQSGVLEQVKELREIIGH